MTFGARPLLVCVTSRVIKAVWAVRWGHYLANCLPKMIPRSGGKVSTVRKGQHSVAEQMSLKPGLIVQELGWDEDVDEDLRDEIMDAIDADLIEDAFEAVDIVLLWMRDDVDVVDSLVDALRDLTDEGYIWLMTPKFGRQGYVDQADLQEGANTAGLSLTTTIDVSPDWQGRKVVRPKSKR